jgi:hypothetical protein
MIAHRQTRDRSVVADALDGRSQTLALEMGADAVAGSCFVRRSQIRALELFARAALMTEQA